MQSDTMPEATLDAVLRGNLARVFNERNSGRRLQAMAELWADDAVMFEADKVFVGHQAISDNVGSVQARLPQGMRFTPSGETLINHGSALLRWQASIETQSSVVTGTDIATFKHQRIHQLHVYLDPH